jgi:hypothetical protein
MILAIAFEVKELMKSKIEVLRLNPSLQLIESRGLLTRECPSGTRGLVYQARPIKEVDDYKDSKIDLDTKKEGSNPYSTRTLVNSCPVAYIKPGRGAPREISKTTYNIIDIEYHRHAILEIQVRHRLDTNLRPRRLHVNTIVIIY